MELTPSQENIYAYYIYIVVSLVVFYNIAHRT